MNTAMTKSQIPPLSLWIKTDSLEIKFLQNTSRSVYWTTISWNRYGRDMVHRPGADTGAGTGMVHTVCV